MSKTEKQQTTLPPAQAVALAGLVEPAPGSIVSRELARTSGGTVTLFAFAAGQGLSEHTAPFDALVQIVEGELELVIGGQKITARPGELVLMPAQVPHGLDAVQDSKMLLIMLRETTAASGKE